MMVTLAFNELTSHLIKLSWNFKNFEGIETLEIYVVIAATSTTIFDMNFYFDIFILNKIKIVFLTSVTF